MISSLGQCCPSLVRKPHLSVVQPFVLLSFCTFVSRVFSSCFQMKFLAWCTVLQASQERNTYYGSYDDWNH